VEAVTQEWEAYLQTVSVDPPHLFGHAWGALYRDENHFMLDACHPTKGDINLGWNPEDPAAARFVQATEAAAAESDPQKRKALYFQAEKLLCVDEAVILPLWHGRLPYLTKPYVDRADNPLARGFARWKLEAHQ
jgi:ABC-type oligopeptide transport system substrate-binding subunit